MIKRAESDGYYAMNDEVLSFIGTIIMWFSLSHLFSGYDLSVYSERYEVEIARVNCLVAGASGGIGAMMLKKILDLKYFSKTRVS